MTSPACAAGVTDFAIDSGAEEVTRQQESVPGDAYVRKSTEDLIPIHRTKKQRIILIKVRQPQPLQQPQQLQQRVKRALMFFFPDACVRFVDFIRLHRHRHRTMIWSFHIKLPMLRLLQLLIGVPVHVIDVLTVPGVEHLPPHFSPFTGSFFKCRIIFSCI